MKKFYIYEVKGIKNGCTIDWDKRCEQNLKKYNITPIVVETYEYPNTSEYWQIVGDREWELAELNGYPKGTHYRVAREKGIVGSKISGKIAVESGHWVSICSMGGKIAGKRNVESGHLKSISSMGGKISGKRNVESGHLAIAIKLAHEARKRPILQYHKDGTFIKEWRSISDAGNELNLYQQNISKACSGKLKTTGGFVFKYKE